MRRIWHGGLLVALLTVQVFAAAATIDRRRVIIDPEPSAGPVSVRLVATRTTYKLDRGARTEAEYRRAIDNRAAKPPRVELELVITNRSKGVIRVQTHGNEVNRWLAGYTLTL